MKTPTLLETPRSAAAEREAAAAEVTRLTSVLRDKRLTLIRLEKDRDALQAESDVLLVRDGERGVAEKRASVRRDLEATEREFTNLVEDVGTLDDTLTSAQETLRTATRAADEERVVALDQVVAHEITLLREQMELTLREWQRTYSARIGPDAATLQETWHRLYGTRNTKIGTAVERLHAAFALVTEALKGA